MDWYVTALSYKVWVFAIIIGIFYDSLNGGNWPIPACKKGYLENQ